MKIALIGLGAIGVPIAHKLFNTFQGDFFLIADEERKNTLSKKEIYINSDSFAPLIVSDKEQEIIGKANILLVCVKNYDLNNIIKIITPFIGLDTIILPLQNGIYSFDFFKNTFPENIILRGYVQGPNTEKKENTYKYENPGELHIGSDTHQKEASMVVELLKKAYVPAFYEPNILKMVWKKWMLNVAGNSVTALTGADYSLFKLYSDLQTICRQAMVEFKSIAFAEGVLLENTDIDDIIQYYVSYVGSKKTSMLMDVINERKTENDYLAGTALQLAKKHNILAPTISTLYYLMEVKEEVYMENKGCRTTDLYTEGIEYSDALRVQMNDLKRKMTDLEYARIITNDKMPDQLRKILEYSVDNSSYYSNYAGFSSLQDFPVMDKMQLKEHYDEIVVHNFDKQKTHKMFTSGSTGIPFAVVQDLAKRERNIADLKYFGKIAGYSDHDPMCYLRAKPIVSLDQQKRDNIWQLDVSSLSERNLIDYFYVIVEKRCTALVGYASTLEVAVDYWAKHFENETSVKTIISTSEELTESTRKKLRDFFGERVRICARYSNSEQGILGQEEGINGEYTLNWASYYFEILKFDTDEEVEPGESGRIVVTDLYNQAFPMIRYDTGDIGKIIKKEGQLPILTKLCGRKMDIIFDINGEPVSPFLISRTMRHSQGIKQWQFIQDTDTEYTLRISWDGIESPNLNIEIEELKKTLGNNAKIQIIQMNSDVVNNANGWKLIVSHLKK